MNMPFVFESDNSVNVIFNLMISFVDSINVQKSQTASFGSHVQPYVQSYTYKYNAKIYILNVLFSARHQF